MKLAPIHTTLFICLTMMCAPVLASWESHILPSDFDSADSLEKAIALAKQKDKAVIVYYTRTNCPPCDALRSRLRSDEEIAASFKTNYVFTVVWGSSMGRDERENYRNRFGVQGAPTWIVFNANGEYVCTSSGGIYTNENGKKIHEAIQSRITAGAQKSETGPQRCRIES